MVSALNILFKGYFYTGSGYAEGNRALLRVLDQMRYTIRISARDKACEKDLALTSAEINYVSSFENTRLASKDIFLNIGSGANLQSNPDFRVNIAHTTFETSGLPKSWVPILNSFNEVWVQCAFNLNTFRSAGVKVPLRLMPHLFNHSLYHPQGEVFPLPQSQRYKFLSIFDLSERKGYDVLLQAFLNEFSSRDDVALVIKIRHKRDSYKLREIIIKHKRRKKDRPPIYFIDKMLKTPALISLYRACNAFVLPTRGEGWGRTFYEAMLMEMPVIGTNWSGHKEYMNQANAYLIRVKELVPVSIINRQDPQKYAGQYWAEPSCEDLQKLMRFVFEHQSKAKETGRKARIELLHKYDTQKITKLVAFEIDKYR